MTKLYDPLANVQVETAQNIETAAVNSPLSGKPMTTVLVGPMGRKFAALADIPNRLVMPKFLD